MCGDKKAHEQLADLVEEIRVSEATRKPTVQLCYDVRAVLRGRAQQHLDITVRPSNGNEERVIMGYKTPETADILRWVRERMQTFSTFVTAADAFRFSFRKEVELGHDVVLVFHISVVRMGSESGQTHCLCGADRCTF